MEVDSSADKQFVDSEDEQEFKEQLKERSECKFVLTQPQPAGGVLFYMQGELSKTMARIVYEENWQEQGKGTATYKDSQKNDVEKTDDVINLYKVIDGVYFMVADPKMKGSYVNEIIDSLLSQATFAKFVVLDNMHKHQYP